MLSEAGCDLGAGWHALCYSGREAARTRWNSLPRCVDGLVRAGLKPGTITIGYPKTPMPTKAMRSIQFSQWSLSLLVGLGGGVLIAAFLLAILQPLSLLAWIPWILAFNCAHAGFYWVSRCVRKDLYFSLGWAFALGLGIAWGCTAILAGLFYLLLADIPLSFLQAVLFSLIGGGCAQAGAWLAARAAVLNRDDG